MHPIDIVYIVVESLHISFGKKPLTIIPLFFKPVYIYGSRQPKGKEINYESSNESAFLTFHRLNCCNGNIIYMEHVTKKKKIILFPIKNHY